MSTRLTAWAVIVVMSPLFFAASSRAAETTPLLKDLTTVIALHGQLCQVVSAVQKSESDYLASCEDGKRYHVFTDAKGRVVVEKQ